MIKKEEILKIAKDRHILKTRDLIERFSVSRQYASRILTELVREGSLLKIGSTRSAQYMHPASQREHPELFPNHFKKKYENSALEEHLVLAEIERTFTALNKLPENIKSIFTFAFSEMLNNAIDHSKSKNISVEISLSKDLLEFTIDDQGVGVFRNVQTKRHLESELEAIQDLLKGKITTAPKLHSGEGIFFTSKVVTTFLLDSFGHQLLVDNNIPDIFIEQRRGNKQGTKVVCKITLKSKQHLNDVFKKYTDLVAGSNYGFDRTEIHVRLFTIGGVYISRSQARRVLSGLEKFKIITMDYDRVPLVGQAFVDEIYRVFQSKYPGITIEDENTNEAVRFMIARAKNTK
jgi:anti-sigma regulatory factor (Ser/Thr protein kinase)